MKVQRRSAFTSTKHLEAVSAWNHFKLNFQPEIFLDYPTRINWVENTCEELFVMNSQTVFSYCCSLSTKIWDRRFPESIWQKEQRDFVRWFVSLGHRNNGAIILWSLRFLYKGDKYFGWLWLGPLYPHVLKKDMLSHSADVPMIKATFSASLNLSQFLLSFRFSCFIVRCIEV